MLTLDITPMAINGTAMHHVVRDTAVHIIFKHPDTRLLLAGAPISADEFISAGFRLTQNQIDASGATIQRLLQNRLAQQPSSQPILGPRTTSDVLVVFDALYILLYPSYTRSIAYVLDLTPLTRPKWHDPLVSQQYKEAFLRLYDPSVTIVTISKSTTDDLWANLAIPRTRVKQVQLYNRFRKQPEATNASKAFLFVGSLELRKNVIGLIRAFGRSKLALDGFTLRIVGGDSSAADSARDLARGTEGVEILGKISDETLKNEYSACAALIFPSFWEGFGLPVLEALAYGKPVLLSDCGALPEVGGPLGIYIDPYSETALPAAMRELANAIENGVYGADYRAQARAWAMRFSLAAYLKSVDTVLQDFTDITGRARPTTPLSRGLRAHSRRSRIGYRMAANVLGRRTAITALPGSLRTPDSFSPEYFFLLTQAKRLELTESIARYRFASPLAKFSKVTSILFCFAALALTNVLARAHINESLLLTLAREEDQGS